MEKSKYTEYGRYILEPLIQARKQAKKEGIKSYGGKPMLQLYSDFALIENSYRFELKGLEVPCDGLSLPLQKFIRLLQAAKKITPDYQITWKPPYTVLIHGKTATMAFSVKIPYIDHNFR